MERARAAAQDPEVREIWLSSEDTGAYGRDIGTSLPELLEALVAVLPSDGQTMLRIGMTNPPYILEHLDAIAKAMHHPSVFAYLHVPVQSGSNAGQRLPFSPSAFFSAPPSSPSSSSPSSSSSSSSSSFTGAFSGTSLLPPPQLPSPKSVTESLESAPTAVENQGNSGLGLLTAPFGVCML